MRIMILLENLNGYLVSKIMVFSCLVDIGSKGVGCSIVVARSRRWLDWEVCQHKSI